MRTTLTTTTSRSASLAAAALAATLTLSACGGSDDPTLAGGGAADPGRAVQATPVAGIAAEHNDADIAFITDMKPHHEGALEMAQLADTRAGSAKVKDLAARIVAAQDPEIQTMQQMAAAWGVDLEAAGSSSMPGMDMGDGDTGGGMDMSGDTAALEPLSGAAFDKEFLTRMTAHHRSAVEMSQKELAEGQNPQAKQLAQEIITAQNKEIAEMTALLATL